MVRERVCLAAVLLAALGLYLIGNASVQLMDRDEPRYAQCSRQMLQSGDWVVPRLFDDIRAKKPPLIYWCQAAVMGVIGDTAFAARLPSLLAIFSSAALLASFVWRIRGPQHAVWATLVFCSSALVIVAAKSSTTDAVLLLWTSIGQACVYLIWRGNRSWGVAILLAVMIALGLLTKGTIVGVLLATILVLGLLRWIDRRRSRKLPQAGGFAKYPPSLFPSPGTPAVGQGGGVGQSCKLQIENSKSQIEEISAESEQPPPRPFAGVPGEREAAEPVPPQYAGLDAESIAFARTAPIKANRIAQLIAGVFIVLILVAPWIYLVHQRSPKFLPAMLHEAEGHAFKGMEGHGGPPGLHLLFIWADFLPWSLLLPAAIVIGWMHRDEPLTRFALAAVIGPWLFAELAIKTKLPEYMLPTFPPLAFLTADAIVRGLRGDGPKFASRQFVGATRIWAVVIILIGQLPWLAALRFKSLPWFSMSIVSLSAIVWGVLVVVLLQRRREAFGIAGIGIGMICLTSLIYGEYLPRAQFLRLSILTASALREPGATLPGQSLMIDYKEPSLAFYQGGTIREQDSALLMHRQYDQWKPWMVITGDVWKRLPEDVRENLIIVSNHRGLSVADAMRDVNVLVVRKK